MDIYLNKEIIENLDLTNYDIAVYVALRSIYVSNKEETISNKPYSAKWEILSLIWFIPLLGILQPKSS